MNKQVLEFLQTRSDNDIIRAVRSLIADASTGDQFTIRFCEILHWKMYGCIYAYPVSSQSPKRK